MRCPNCRCEIGNLTTCPYCGVRVFRSSVSRTEPCPPTNTDWHKRTPSANRQTTSMTSWITSDKRLERHMENLDLWGLLCVILLVGIFVLELLQFLVALL